MSVTWRHREGFGRLETLLALAFAALALQVFPSLWSGLLWAIDPRHWSRGGWLGLNLAIVVALFGVRFLPQLFEDWRQRRSLAAQTREKRQKQQQAKEHREAIERLRRGRSRRMY